MGIGDRNPLYLDPNYGKASVWGVQLAPPTILYAMDRIVSGYVGGLPGIHAMFAGTTWSWNRPIRLGDRIQASARLKELIERPSRFAGRSIQQIYEVTFTDSDGATVATADSWCFRTERDAARELGKYRETKSAVVTDETLNMVRNAYDAEAIRGSQPRRATTTTIGETLGTIVRGPYTPTMAVAFVQGWGGLYVFAHGYAFDLFRRHPATAILNSHGVPEPPERVHWDDAMARAAGVPAAYDYGPERVSWLGTLVTNWMGDSGILRRLHVEVRRHNLSGEVVWCSGKVTDVQPEGDSALVYCDLQARTHEGELSAKGSAVVQLPN
jgi:acyl dehydratase